jgi:DNA-binding response OmpR family regulator/DNA-binding CsgD family transcriptional regulator
MKHYTILIIDDDATSIETIVDILSGEKYRTLFSSNGLQGVKIAQKEIPDLIITDWEMDKTDGIVTIKMLKEAEQTNQIPIIMATGKRLMPEDLKIALEAGAVDYIRKPFDATELLARVRSMLMLFESMKKNIELEKKLHDEKVRFLKNEVDIKNKELSEKIMQVHSFYESGNMAIDNLDKMFELSDNDEVKEMIRRTINIFKDTNRENIWNEFEIVFEQINHNFFRNLISQFPDITYTERKLCAFLKLDLNTKEIATISNKSIDAIRKTRYRLRKKFRLNNDDDLSHFIQSL